MKRIKKEVKATSDDVIKHDYTPAIFPYFDHWKKIYGRVFMFLIGSTVSLYVSDPDLTKDLCLNKSLFIGKADLSNRSFKAMFGKGIILSSGHAWEIQRKIIAPEFFMLKVKGMIDLMEESAQKLLKSWDEKIESGKGIADIKIDEDIHKFIANVLSRACFGTNYSSGEEIFSKMSSLHHALPLQSQLARFPGSMHIPTKGNRIVWKLSREIQILVEKIVTNKRQKGNEEKILLEVILNKSEDEGVDKSFIVDNCKNIYFAGSETTVTTTNMVLMLLAHNPEWQMRVREEVMNVCGDSKLDFDKLNKLSMLTQVIQETLRLYPPAVIIVRQLNKDMKLGHLHLPKGISLWIPILHFHHDPDLWGPDVNQFKPERFAKGVSGACKHPHMFMPFGFGPRTCLGQNFAMIELKVVLALILLRYKVSPSPNYKHSMELSMLLGPKYGVHVVMERV